MAAGGVGTAAAPAAADGMGVRVLTPDPHPLTSLGAPTGTSLVLLEGSTGQIIAALDGHRRRPVASAIKLVTALTVIEALPAGSIVVVGEEVRGVEGSSYGLRPGQARTVEDLLIGLLLRSGNDAALALAHAVAGSEEEFVLRMTGVLARLGVEASPVSASGLAPGDALSAADLAIVSRAALAEPRIRDIVGVVGLRSDTGGVVENRNLFIGQFPGATGLKTGFTSAAGYTISASARRDGRELIAVILGAPDDRVRRATAAGLLEYGFSGTEVRSVGHTVTLRTSRGPVRFGTDGVRVTVANGTDVVTMWPRLLRPDDLPSGVVVHVGGRPSGSAAVTRRDGRDERGAQGLGEALADGVYAALRPLGLDEGLR
jgi:D-alanyl-D-alanine carboxypeptidase (penicillin-binding protein 5/6)